MSHVDGHLDFLKEEGGLTRVVEDECFFPGGVVNGVDVGL